MRYEPKRKGRRIAAIALVALAAMLFAVCLWIFRKDIPFLNPVPDDEKSQDSTAGIKGASEEEIKQQAEDLNAIREGYGLSSESSISDAQMKVQLDNLDKLRKDRQDQ